MKRRRSVSRKPENAPVEDPPTSPDPSTAPLVPVSSSSSSARLEESATMLTKRPPTTSSIEPSRCTCRSNQPTSSSRKCRVCHEDADEPTKNREQAAAIIKVDAVLESSEKMPLRNRNTAAKPQPSGKKSRVVSCCTETKDLKFGESNRNCAHEGCRILVNDRYRMKVEVDKEESVEFDYCLPCFNEIKKNDRNFSTGSKMKTNINTSVERILECIKCQNKLHQCCAFQYTKDDFVCLNCEPKVTTLDGHRRNQCDRELEKTLNPFWIKLVKEKLKADIAKENSSVEDTHKFLNCKLSVVSFRAAKSTSIEKIVPKFYLDRYQKRYGDVIEYETRNIYLFQRIGEVDVCVFSMICQEYRDLGKRSWAVIDYMDSLNFVKPDDCRGKLYGEAINAYLAYAKAIGFKEVHFMANAPSHNQDDYIFNVHPAGTVYRDEAGLVRWYDRVLQKGETDGVIKSKLLFKDFQKSCRTPTGMIPFDGGLWPRCLMEIEENMELVTPGLDGKKYETEFEKRLKKKFNDNGENNFFIKFTEGGQKLEEKKELNPHAIFGDKDEFIYFCRQVNWEFSSLRRAAYSSVGMIRVILGLLDTEAVREAAKLSTHSNCS